MVGGTAARSGRTRPPTCHRSVETNEFVGTCGFFQTPQQHEWEPWLLLRQKFWGVGIGGEVTSALTATAFSSLGALRVVGIVDPTNHASLAMIKKLGFTFAGEYKGKEIAHWQQGHHVYSVEPHTHNRPLHPSAFGVG